MVVGSVIFTLGIEQAFSLKDKRKILNSLKAKLRNKFNIAVSEVGLQDVWNRSELAVVSVSGDRKRLDSLLSGVMNFMESFHDVEVIGIEEEIL